MKTLAASLLAAVIGTAAYAGENVTYKVDGTDYEGYFAKAEGASKGLVLIVHDWDGLDAYEQKRAEMLSKMGYDAFAVDLFGKGNRPETVEKRRAETGKLYKDRDRMRSLLLGGLAEAQKQSSGDTVVIGYCFGGAAALELARSGKASKVVGYSTFHGGLATPQGQSYNPTRLVISLTAASTPAKPPFSSLRPTTDISTCLGSPRRVTIFRG